MNTTIVFPVLLLEESFSIEDLELLCNHNAVPNSDFILHSFLNMKNFVSNDLEPSATTTSSPLLEDEK